MKTLIIDGQILQTAAWDRGMGRYLMSLLKELDQKTSEELEVLIVFNRLLSNNQARLETIKQKCPSIVQLYLDLPVTHGRPSGTEKYKRILSNELARHLKGHDVYFLITALFFFDFFADFPEGCKKLLLIYDLIPFLFWSELGHLFPAEFYMQRLKMIVEADHVFAISKTTKQDLINCFGLPEARITNINGGFSGSRAKMSKPLNVEIPEKYILFPTGDLPHKNNELAIKGFETYRREHDQDMVLIITSTFSEALKERLSSLSPNILFTGHVTDGELSWLYNNTRAVLFASLHEGLGLPVLDAVAFKKPIVASKVPVFEEMSKEAFYFFSPHDVLGLARAIGAALSRLNYNNKAKHYKTILSKYTWPNTCESFLNGLNRSKLAAPKQENKKPRIALACIYPGIAEQIGRKAEALYGSLSEHYKVDFYFDFGCFSVNDTERPSFLEYFDINIYNINRLNRHSFKKYRLIIYLIDTKSVPSRLAQRACVLPGITLAGSTPKTEENKMFMSLALSNQIKTFSEPKKASDLSSLTTEIKTLLATKK